MLEYDEEPFTIYALVNSDKVPKNCRLIVDPYALELTKIPERWTDFIYNAVVECNMVKLLAVTEYYLDKTTAILIAKLLKSHPTISEIFFDRISSNTNRECLEIILDAIPCSKIQKFTFQLYVQNLDVLKKLSNALISSKVTHISIICGYIDLDNKIIAEWLTPILQKSKSVTSLSITCPQYDRTAFKKAMEFNTTITELRLSCEDATDPLHPVYETIQKSNTIRNIVIKDKIFEDVNGSYTLLCNALLENKSVNQIEFDGLFLRSDSSPEHFQKLQNILQIIKQRNIVVQLTLNVFMLEDESTLKMLSDLIEQNLVNGLHLVDYYIPEPEMKLLFAALKKNTIMERITFREVTWETDVPGYIAEYVRSAKNLKVLKLYGDHIYSEANFLRLLDGIGANANLTTVCIGMETNFCKQLFDFMAKNKTIKILEVPHITIEEGHIEAYCNFLEQNDTLTSLSFTNAVLEKQHIDQIRKSLEKNSSLVQCKAGLRGRENDVIKRNRQHYGDLKSGAIILAHNIMRSEYAKSLLPVEIWRSIFSYLSYPGIGSCRSFTENIF